MSVLAGSHEFEVMEKGGLVSDSLVLSIVEKKLSAIAGGWLLDGFPRTLPQAESLEILLQQIHQPIDAVVLIELKDEVLIKRLLARGRSDDDEAVIRHRIQLYKEKTAPLVDHYNKQGLVNTIRGDGDIEAIASRIKETLK